MPTHRLRETHPGCFLDNCIEPGSIDFGDHDCSNCVGDAPSPLAICVDNFAAFKDLGKEWHDLLVEDGHPVLLNRACNPVALLGGEHSEGAAGSRLPPLDRRNEVVRERCRSKRKGKNRCHHHD